MVDVAKPKKGRRGRSGLDKISALEFFFMVSIGILLFAESPFTFPSAGLGVVVGILFWGIISAARRAFGSSDRTIRDRRSRREGTGLNRWIRTYARTWFATSLLFTPVSLFVAYLYVGSELFIGIPGPSDLNELSFILLWGLSLGPILSIFLSLPTSLVIDLIRQHNQRH